MSLAGLSVAPTRSRYVPGWPTLAPWGLIGKTAAPPPFPFNAAHHTWFYRASNAIYHLFKALDLQPWDVVLAPDYHSGNEIWAMRAAGARIVFYPTRRNGEPDLDALETLYRRHRPRVVYVIHLLGWAQPMDEIMALCQDGDTVVVEDCALSMFGEYNGRPLGSIGDYAIYCLYKTLPVPNGGLLVQNRRTLPALSRLALPPCDAATMAGRPPR
ncbi:MAG: aminotransferase class V-fold PLP-dependent enzyme [Xanthomonadaceae bacterium]|nr:aminotransferase class V-fold PLP-dependent enzyme [Xanthomonadaceae bacterium]